MATLTGESPAKINLTLRVTGVRTDRFHEIESLVAQVDLSDTVTVSSQDDGCYSLDCDDPTLPRDGSNLVLQATAALARAASANRGAHIALAKRIPAGAGLGGGSSNAATTLSLLNELWETGLSQEELVRLAAGLGSDVPLFLHGPLCVIRGRGEQVEELARPLCAWAALILPEMRCPTPAVYAAWDRLIEKPARPALGDVRAALGTPAELMDLLFNDLEAPAFEVTPPLRQLAECVAAVGGARVCLTGSGSTLFRLFESQPAAASFAAEVGSRLGVRTAVAQLRGPRALE